MIEDFNTCKTQAEFDCDVCIIGAGAAGVTLARELLTSGLDVMLLESGGADFEADIQDMAAGENTGFSYYDLDHSRLRFFGGTCAIWGGRCAQLDAIDFEKRDWVAYSGWPFSKDALVPYYQRAQKLLQIPVVNDNELPGYKNPFDHAKLRPSFWQFDEKFDRFALHSSQDLKQAARLKILLHATVTQLEVSVNGKQVESARIANLQGGRGQVRARKFVLATGGLEVPRLLLASKSAAHPHGLGNNHDLVGRFFMEHPRARGAHIIPKNVRAFFKLLPATARHRGHRYSMLLRPGEDLQAQDALLNSGFTLSIRKHAGRSQESYKQIYNAVRHDMSPNRLGRALWKIVRKSSFLVNDTLGSALKPSKVNKEAYGLYAVMRAEQAPNPNSRVVLGEKKDALGVPRAVLDWQFSALDKHSALGAVRALDHEMRRLDLGYAEPSPWLLDDDNLWEFDPLVSNHPIGGYHHMGTARMASSAKEGVCDGEGRVHGVDNLYIAGSAVFPTSGWANPTLTILALTLRLGDMLKQVGAR